MRMKNFSSLIIILSLVLAIALSSKAMGAYSSHQNDEDVKKFQTVYPYTKSTKLDDCSLCHPGGAVTQDGKAKSYGSCDYCHIVYGLQAPHGAVPLNGYGQAYDQAGRSEVALRGIEGEDSDGDSFSNLDEVHALFLPGDGSDYPGLVSATVVVLNLERLLKLDDHSQFLFSNHTKSTDEYARYRGVKDWDLLRYLRVSAQATQITVFAPDGFSKTFPIDIQGPQTAPNIQYDVKGPYPRGPYYPGLDFVKYSYDPWFASCKNLLPDKLYMQLAYLRDGDPIAKGRLLPDPKTPGRLVLDGEGPYRLVVPQKVPGSPDRPSTAAPVGDGWDYDPNKDHNAGFSVRSVAAIRVEPLPPGSTDFRWSEGGWNLVDKARVVVYGAIDPWCYPVSGRISDNSGKPVSDVQVSIGLVSLGQVGTADSNRVGEFRADFPAGEYVVVPSRAGYKFHPESILIELPRKEGTVNFTASAVQ